MSGGSSIDDGRVMKRYVELSVLSLSEEGCKGLYVRIVHRCPLFSPLPFPPSTSLPSSRLTPHAYLVVQDISAAPASL